jgi:hypothetical protein
LKQAVLSPLRPSAEFLPTPQQQLIKETFASLPLYTGPE